MNRDRLIHLFSKLRNKLETNNKLSRATDIIVKNIKDACFFNQMKTICVYNNSDSISLNNILLDRSNYLRNAFVLPRLNDNGVSFYHISDPEDLIIDELGVKDVVPGCFKIDTTEIDVILVSGLSFDRHGNWLHDDYNTKLYNKVLKKIDKVSIGVSLECQIYARDLPNTECKTDSFLTEEGLYNIVNILGV